MKKLFLMLFTLLLFSTFNARAEIISGTYYGEVKFQQAIPATIYVLSIQRDDMSYAFGLILLQNNQGALYRIEELADGTMVWLTLYQGQNYVLKVRNDSMPVFKGAYLKKEDKVWLQLTPTRGMTFSEKNCMRPEILAKQGSKDSWITFPALETQYYGPGDSEGLLATDIYRGNLVFKGSSHNGNFSLGQITPFLATVRPSVVSPITLSGWELQRQMLGVVVSLSQRKFFGSYTEQLVFMHLPPAKEDSCFYETTMVSTK